MIASRFGFLQINITFWALGDLQKLQIGVERQEGYLQRWLNESTLEKIQGFLITLTGAKTLKPNARLSVNPVAMGMVAGNALFFHTYYSSMDTPLYASYEDFHLQMEGSISIPGNMAGFNQN